MSICNASPSVQHFPRVGGNKGRVGAHEAQSSGRVGGGLTAYRRTSVIALLLSQEALFSSRLSQFATFLNNTCSMEGVESEMN